jgi:Flp pilus assembly pilin Flp
MLPREDVRVLTYFNRFLSEEHGAISVDYTVLSAAAVSMAIATTAIVTGGIDNLTQRIDTELRERQLNDTFIEFESAHFEPLYMAGLLSEDDAGDLWNTANTKMNQELIDQLADGIAKIQDGSITEEELGDLFAAASVAYQRNIVDDAVLEHYFGLDGSAPATSLRPPNDVAPRARAHRHSKPKKPVAQNATGFFVGLMRKRARRRPVGSGTG